MKAGDLRRFDDMSNSGNHDDRRVSGKIFMIVETGSLRDDDCWANILIDGQIDKGWSLDWLVACSSRVSDAG